MVRLNSLLLLSISSLVTGASIKSTPKAKIGTGVAIGQTVDGIDSWRGIDYALPPVGSLRLMPPIKSKGFKGTRDFFKDPDSCFNLNSTVPVASSLTEAQGTDLLSLTEEAKKTEVYQTIAANAMTSSVIQSEDCLYLNVHRPSGTTKKSKLPVVIWVYGGSFTSSDITEFRPENLLKRSIELNSEIIFVSMNYRVAAYGFLSGEDVVAHSATNNGLKDQRLAFEWVKEHITEFGGDADAITLWGQSAGAISLGLHLVHEGKTSAEGLYRSMIMESGAPIRLSSSSFNATYSQISSSTGCDSSSDRFKCLQQLSPENFNVAMNAAAASGPVVDGAFIPDYPDQMVRDGRFVKDVAILTGNEDDEGALLTLNIIQSVTSKEAFDFFLRSSLAGLTESQYSHLKELYPSDPSAGEPYGTANDFNVTGWNKATASIYGDFAFQYPRRSLLSKLASSDNAGIYSYLHSTFKSTPLLGAYHSTELVNTFGWMKSSTISREMTARWIGFINDQKPNSKGYSNWPLYTFDGKKLLHFGEKDSNVEKDDFRKEQIDYLEEIAESLT